MNPRAKSVIYQIRIEGHLDERWLCWLEGLDVSPLPEGETIISGEMDQAALHGILNRISDLGLELISVQRKTDQAQACPKKHLLQKNMNTRNKTNFARLGTVLSTCSSVRNFSGSWEKTDERRSIMIFYPHHMVYCFLE